MGKIKHEHFGPCGHRSVKTIDTRVLADGNRRRRYRCKECGDRWSTIELQTEYAVGKPGTGLDSLRAQWGLSEDQMNAIDELVRSFSVRGE